MVAWWSIAAMLNSEAVRMTRMEVLDVENVADIMVTVDSAVAKQHWQCVPKLYRHIVPSLHHFPKLASRPNV